MAIAPLGPHVLRARHDGALPAGPGAFEVHLLRPRAVGFLVEPRDAVGRPRAALRPARGAGDPHAGDVDFHGPGGVEELAYGAEGESIGVRAHRPRLTRQTGKGYGPP